MRTRVTFALLAVLTLLAGVNVIRGTANVFSDWFGRPDHDHVAEVAAVQELEIRVEAEALRAEADALREQAQQIRVEALRTVEAELAAARGDEARLFRQTFAASADQRLDVALAHMDLKVVPWTRDEVSVEVFARVDDLDRAKGAFDRLRFSAEQDGDRVRVRIDPRRDAWQDWNRAGARSMRAVIQVPARVDASIQHAHGDVALGALQGQLSLDAAHGDVVLGALRGPRLSIQTAHGDVQSERLTADELRINTAHGDLDLAVIESARSRISAAHSDVRIGRASGEIDVESAHGDIDLRLTESADVRLRAQHADIDVASPASYGADLDLSGDDVHIASAFRFTGESSDEKVRGRINDGGGRLYARTSYGSINLRSY